MSKELYNQNSRDSGAVRALKNLGRKMDEEGKVETTTVVLRDPEKYIEWLEKSILGMTAAEIAATHSEEVTPDAVKQGIRKAINYIAEDLDDNERRARLTAMVGKGYSVMWSEYNRLQNLLKKNNFEGIRERDEAEEYDGDGNLIRKVVRTKVRNPSSDIASMLKSLKELAAFEALLHGISKAKEDTGPTKIEIAISGFTGAKMYTDPKDAPDVEESDWQSIPEPTEE